MPETATIHRDKNRTHGNTLVRTLRKTYGANFAKGCADNETLMGVLYKLDGPSLSNVIHAWALGADLRCLN